MADHPAHGHRACQPEPLGAVGVAQLGLVPVPAAAVGALQSRCAPSAQSLPGIIGITRFQGGAHEPGVGGAIIPPGQQGAREATGSCVARCGSPYPAPPLARRRSRIKHQAANRCAMVATVRPPNSASKGTTVIRPHERVSAIPQRPQPRGAKDSVTRMWSLPIRHLVRHAGPAAHWWRGSITAPARHGAPHIPTPKGRRGGAHHARPVRDRLPSAAAQPTAGKHRERPPSWRLFGFPVFPHESRGDAALGKLNRETRKQKGSAITLSAALFQLSTFSFQLSL